MGIFDKLGGKGRVLKKQTRDRSIFASNGNAGPPTHDYDGPPKWSQEPMPRDTMNSAELAGLAARPNNRQSAHIPDNSDFAYSEQDGRSELNARQFGGLPGVQESASSTSGIPSGAHARLDNTSSANIRHLRQLIRQKYRLDVYVWAHRDVLPADRAVIKAHALKSDAIMQLIKHIVEGWRRNMFNDEEWKLANQIKTELLNQHQHHRHQPWSQRLPWDYEEESDEDQYSQDSGHDSLYETDGFGEGRSSFERMGRV